MRLRITFANYSSLLRSKTFLETSNNVEPRCRISQQLVESTPARFVHTKASEDKKKKRKGKKLFDAVPGSGVFVSPGLPHGGGWVGGAGRGSNLHSDSANRSVQNSVMKAWTALRPLRAIRTLMNGSGGAPTGVSIAVSIQVQVVAGTRTGQPRGL